VWLELQSIVGSGVSLTPHRADCLISFLRESRHPHFRAFVRPVLGGKSLPLGSTLERHSRCGTPGAPGMSRCSAEIFPDSEPSFIGTLSEIPQMGLKGSAAGSLLQPSRMMATSSYVQTDLEWDLPGWPPVPLGISGYAPRSPVALLEALSQPLVSM
jgi:hypothetical protein